MVFVFLQNFCLYHTVQKRSLGCHCGRRDRRIRPLKVCDGPARRVSHTVDRATDRPTRGRDRHAVGAHAYMYSAAPPQEALRVGFLAAAIPGLVEATTPSRLSQH